MTDTLPIVERLRENIIADAYEDRRLTDGVMADRLIRERHGAADLIEKLTEALANLDDATRDYDDLGPDGEGYPSARLRAAREAARAALELAKKA